LIQQLIDPLAPALAAQQTERDRESHWPPFGRRSRPASCHDHPCIRIRQRIR
jgi:hypothetical protein